MSKKELCPVCGYNVYEKFGLYPWDNDISSLEVCPSCGIQFGYSDAAGGDQIKREEVHKKWREDWINNGMPWGQGEYHDRPEDWDPQRQLDNLLG